MKLIDLIGDFGTVNDDLIIFYDKSAGANSDIILVQYNMEK
jgi:hypothetical protein